MDALETGILLIGLSALLIVLYLVVIVRLQERKDFNRGICKCGEEYNLFGTDSRGYTGWICRKCKKTVWTYWINTKKYIKRGSQ